MKEIENYLNQLTKHLEQMTFFGKYAVVAVLTAFLVMLIFAGQSPLLLKAFIALMIVVVFFSADKLAASKKEQIRLLGDFLKENHLQPVDGLDKRSLSGRLFHIGHSKNASDVFTSSYKNLDTRLFKYTYTVGTGEDSSTFRFTVCEISLDKTIFPHILLKPQSMPRFGDRDYFGQDKDAEIPLEGKAGDYLELFSTQEYEIEALQIFSEEILDILTEKRYPIAIEFAEKKIYFFQSNYVTQAKGLRELYDTVKLFIDHRGELLEHLHDDFDSLREAYGEKEKI